MKAKLMIGDWVINPVHHDKTKIEGIYYDKELHCLVATDGRFPQEMFEPIPLTEEILKENGFVFGKTDYKDYTLSFRKEYQYKDSRMGLRIISRYFVCDLVNIPLSYVHELQHALRLCGLTELADNFVMPQFAAKT